MVMDLEETEAQNDCAGEDQQQFNQPTKLRDRIVRQQPAGNGVSMKEENITGSRYQATASEDIAN
jgi:hypothetical protein